MAGRKPKPSHLKIVQGNAGKRAMNKKEPKPKRFAPPPPDHFNTWQSKRWNKIVTELDRMGVMTTADVFALEGLVEALWRYEDAKRILNSYGSMTYENHGPSGMLVKKHPAVGIMENASRDVRAWFAEFGLTPSARTRVAAQDGEEDEENVDSFFTA